MTKGLEQSQNAALQPGLDKIAIPRPAPANVVEKPVELSGTSFKFKVDSAQQAEAMGHAVREAIKPSLSTGLARTQAKIAAAGRGLSISRFFSLETGRTVIDGVLTLATAILKLLDKILMFLLRTNKPILTRLVLPKSVGELEATGASLKQKKKKAPGRDGAAMS